MRQIVKKNKEKLVPKIKKPKNRVKKSNNKSHPNFGTSKLEQDFAKDFLDKLNVEYEWQFEAKEIGRYYDFRIKDGPIIEINGGYWHGDPRIYESKDLNGIQKKTQRVDEHKKKWALMHGIPIYYFWEKDIKERPKEVLEELKKILYIKDQSDNRRKRNFGKKRS